jgi:hypothetical protein
MAKKKPNFLSAAEIKAEDNYNFVGDGLINNNSRPSILVHLEALEQRKRERHREDINDSRQERHREERHQAAEER